MTEDPPSPRAPHPILFAALLIPYGVSGGYVTVTLGYLLAHAGVSTAAISAAVAVYISMQIWKFLFAPLVDVSLSYRTWYGIGVVGVCASVAVAGLLPLNAAAMPLVTGLVAVLGAFQGLTSISTDGLVSNIAGAATKGRAGGWVQAGSLGGSGLGGGGGLWIAAHAGPGLANAALALACLIPLAAVMPLSEPDHAHRSPRLGPTVLALGREIWALVRSRTGGIAIFLLLLPLGTGAASNLFPAIAKDYGASAGMVALVTGVLSGLVQIPGSLAGGYLADRLGRRPIYWGGALAMALCALLMAAAPRSPLSFAVGTLTYAVTLGVIWGAYSGVVYAAAGGAGAATKCNVLSSLCNIPIAAMTALDGWAQTRWGTAAMLGVEGVVAVGAVGFYLAVLQVVSRPGRGGVGAAAETLS